MRYLLSVLLALAFQQVLFAADEEEPKLVMRDAQRVGDWPFNSLPAPKDFRKNQVHETKAYWRWHRSPGRGGQNVGDDFFVPAERVLVGWSANIISEHHTKGPADWKIVCEMGAGEVAIPRGVHTGIRLTPGKLAARWTTLEDFLGTFGDPRNWSVEEFKKFGDGGGAAFHGEFVLKYVTSDDWWDKWVEMNRRRER